MAEFYRKGQFFDTALHKIWLILSLLIVNIPPLGWCLQVPLQLKQEVKGNEGPEIKTIDSGVYIHLDKLENIKALHYQKPNKFVTALYNELVGEKVLSQMSYSQIPDRLKNTIHSKHFCYSSFLLLF